MEDSHQNFISLIIDRHFHATPKAITRMTVGTANEVYAAALPDQEVIVRMSPYDKFLLGSRKNIPLFKSLGIPVPTILFENYNKDIVPYNYQILTKIPGEDIGEVIATLKNEQLKSVAQKVAEIITKIRRLIPSQGGFGYIYGNADNLVSTWTEYMQNSANQAIERGRQTGVLESWMKDLLDSIVWDNKQYFDSVVSETYFDDISSKNVMIYNGAFSGLVDLDCLAQGDYLEAVGRIKASWFGTGYGEVYSNAVMDELNLDEEQRKQVTVYALFNRLFWACENGIQMNQNTKPVVNLQRDQENKQIIRAIAGLDHNS